MLSPNHMASGHMLPQPFLASLLRCKEQQWGSVKADCVVQNPFTDHVAACYILTVPYATSLQHLRISPSLKMQTLVGFCNY